MANSVDPDQLASLKPTDLYLHCLQRQDISGFSRTRVKGRMQSCKLQCCHMKNLNETETTIFVLVCVWCFQGQPL